MSDPLKIITSIAVLNLLVQVLALILFVPNYLYAIMVTTIIAYTVGVSVAVAISVYLEDSVKGETHD